MEAEGQTPLRLSLTPSAASFASEQIADHWAHQAALALHQAYAANGDTEAFKKIAGGIVPVVQKHIGGLDKMPM